MSLPRAAWPLALGGMLVLGYIGPQAAMVGLAVLFVATVVLTTRAIIDVHRKPKPLPPPSLFPPWDEYLDRLAADDSVPMDRLIEAAEQRATGASPPGWLPPSSKVRVDASNPVWERPAQPLIVVPPAVSPATAREIEARFRQEVGGRPILMSSGTYRRQAQVYEANRRAILREQYHPVGIRRCGHYPARRVMTPVTDPDTGEYLGAVDCCPDCYEDVNGKPPPVVPHPDQAPADFDG